MHVHKILGDKQITLTPEELAILVGQPRSRRRVRYRAPVWARRAKNILSNYGAHWFLGFVAGYIIAALVAAPHWGQLP